MRTLPLQLLAATLFAACSAAVRETTIKIVDLDNDLSHPARLVVDGVAIEILGDLKAELGIYRRSQAGSTQLDFTFGESEVPFANGQSGVWVRGNAIRVENGRLWLGELACGPVRPGQQVTLDLAGVHVGEQLRRELPARP
jgi:hypothetical protein